MPCYWSLHDALTCVLMLLVIALLVFRLVLFAVLSVYLDSLF